MEVFLYLNHILFRDHEKYVKSISQRLKDASTAAVREQELPVEYLWRGATDKDRTARRIAAERGITEGDVCVLSAVEPAPSFQHERT